MKKKIKLYISTASIANPFFVYIISFLIVLIVFSLYWSDLYDEMNIKLLVFILTTSIFSFFLGRLIKKKRFYRRIPASKNNFKAFAFIIIGNLIEYVYCRNVPLLSVFLHQQGNYRDFEGIPTFHVFLAGLSIFFAVYVFHQFRSNQKNKKLLFYSVCSLIPFVLGLNRGVLIIIIVSDFFIYLMQIEKINFKKIMLIMLGIILGFYFFGKIGNIRAVSSIKDNTYILKVGGANNKYFKSNVSNEYFWAYLYVASPIGNLQNIINHKKPDYSFFNFISLLVEETNPDFIAKRLAVLLPEKKDNSKNYLVNTSLNAPTVFFRPFELFGWFGMIYLFLFMVFFIFLYILIVNSKSKFFLTGWSFIHSTVLLNMFSNMWYHNGLYLIIIAIFLSFLDHRKIKSLIFG